MIDEKCEHMKPITCLTGFKTNDYKAVTGSKDGALKVSFEVKKINFI